MSQLLTIVSLVVLLAARASDAQVGSAPVNWGDDSSTVALWTFNGNANNVSASRTYCAAGEADLTRYAGQSGGLSFDSSNRQEGSASIRLDGATTLAAQSSINDTRCLRTGSPNQWTMTFWMRNTSLNTATSSPFPMIIFNRDEAAKRRHWPERLLRDVHQRRREHRGPDVRVHAREEPVERRLRRRSSPAR